MSFSEIHPLLFVILTVGASVGVLVLVSMVFMKKLRKARPSPSEFEWAVERMSNDMLDQMTSKINSHMEQFRSKVEDITKIAELKLIACLSDNLLCSSCLMTKENLVTHILGPLTRAGLKNNFSVMLSKQMFCKYRADLMSLVKDRHVYLKDLIRNTRCTVSEYFPEVDKITIISEEVYDFWLYRVLFEYTEATKGCLDICFDFKRQFYEDDFRVGRIEVRVGKYQASLANLERRFVNEHYSPERRAS